METYEVSLVHKSTDGNVSRPLIVLNVDAKSDEDAKVQARITAEHHRPSTANTFVLFRGPEPIFEGSLGGVALIE